MPVHSVPGAVELTRQRIDGGSCLVLCDQGVDVSVGEAIEGSLDLLGGGLLLTAPVPTLPVVKITLYDFPFF